MRQFLREKCDDIDRVVIPITAVVGFRGPAGEVKSFRGPLALLETCTGETIRLAK